MVGEKGVPWHHGSLAEGWKGTYFAWENFSTSFWWYKCKFMGSGYHLVSEYQEGSFLPPWRTEQKRPEERTEGERKEELWRAWSSLLTKTMTLECAKDTAKMEVIPVPFFQFSFFFNNILWKNPSKLFGQPNSRKIFSFCVGSLCGNSKMVMIFTSMLHSTVWRKYVRSETLKARDRENVLEIFRNPDNSSVFL